MALKVSAPAMCHQGPSLLIFQENPEIQKILRTSGFYCVDTINTTKHCKPNKAHLQVQSNPQATKIRTQI